LLTDQQIAINNYPLREQFQNIYILPTLIFNNESSIYIVFTVIRFKRGVRT